MAGTSTVGTDCGRVVFCLCLHDQLCPQVFVFFLSFNSKKIYMKQNCFALLFSTFQGIFLRDVTSLLELLID